MHRRFQILGGRVPGIPAQFTPLSYHIFSYYTTYTTGTVHLNDDTEGGVTILHATILSRHF